jgi:hypothetical protein
MSKKNLISEALAKSVHAELWEKAEKEYGQATSVPKEVVADIGERVRSAYVLAIWNRDGATGNPAKFLRSYSVSENVIADMVSSYCGIEVTEEEVSMKTERRADKHQSFLDWSKDHLFEQYTTDQLMEVSGFSYPTTLKILQESPNFRKVKKGLWEVRDPKADREAEVG